jgi:LytS/YehU family sensor histidine kinase
VAALILGIPLGALTQLTHVAYVQNSAPLPEMFPGLPHGAYVLIQLGLQITSCTVVFIVWLSLYFLMTGLREYRSSRLVQAEQSRALHLAELRLLKSQLKPHFLFNALNTVSSLIAENPPRAQSAVKLLANTLRHSLRSRPEELVPLAQEMSIVTDYLELESMRFEDRLHVETAIAADAAPARIPVMVLQTLVENAIKHGIAELPAGGMLRISARVESDELIVEVQNPRANNPLSSGDGIGLRNARERLRLFFGDRASLDLDFSLPAMVTARLKVPCQS